MDERLLKRARKKFHSTSLANELVRLNSPLKKSYALTHKCCDQLMIDGDQSLRSVFYCKKRWCQTCASIQMATQINNYLPQIREFSAPHFVTLSLRNVSASKLPDTLDLMTKTFRNITDLARKRGVKLKGLRKLELKVGKNGLYHPHYHMIVEGIESSSYIVTDWLNRLPNHTSPKAQDITEIDPSNLEVALLELMKYATKITCAEDGGNEILCSAEQMNVIFVALHKRRLYQPFGGLRKISEDLLDIENIDVIKRAQGLYQWVGHDWYHTEYGQPLSNWKPEQLDLAMYKRNGVRH